MFDEGTGAEVTQRIAAPTFGGVLGTTVLALPVGPALLLLWRRRVDEIDEPPCLALPQRKNFTPHSIDVSAVGRFRIEQPSPVCTKHFSVSVIE